MQNYEVKNKEGERLTLIVGNRYDITDITGDELEDALFLGYDEMKDLLFFQKEELSLQEEQKRLFVKPHHLSEISDGAYYVKL